jgi:hypothetical protein
MANWRNFEDAIRIVIDREKKRNPNLVQAIKESSKPTSIEQQKLDLEWAKFWLSESKTDTEFKLKAAEFEEKYWPWSSWYFQTNWDFTVTSWTTGNRPDRNNNPWNVKIWDIGYWVDNQNHTIFPDAWAWYEAMVKDITAKLTWGSRHSSKLTWEKLSPNSTLADLWSVYAEDTNWINNVVNIAKNQGYIINKNTKLSNIDVNKLAPAIAKAEWFTWTISQKVSSTEEFNPDITWDKSVEEFSLIPWYKAKQNEIWLIDPNLRVQANWITNSAQLTALYKKALENKEKKNIIEEEKAKKEVKKLLLEWDQSIIKQTIEGIKTDEVYRNWLQEAFNINPRLGKKLNTTEAWKSFENLQNTIKTIEGDLVSWLEKKNTKWEIINKEDIEKIKKEILNPVLKQYWIYYKDWKYKIKIVAWPDIDINNPNRGDMLYNFIQEKLYKK